jgi:hypothetical protein
MGRPPRPIGVCGTIKVTELGPKRFEARAEYRDRTGKTRPVRRRGETKTAATNAVLDAVQKSNARPHKGKITPEQRIQATAALFMEELDRDRKKGRRSAGTVRVYKSRLRNWILPEIGAKRWCELTIGDAEDVIETSQDRRSFETASTVKTTLSLLVGFAARHGAIDSNIVRDVRRLDRGDEERKEIRALESAERTDIRKKVATYTEKRTVDSKKRSLGPRAKTWRDIRDMCDAFLSTGGRISEIVAIYREDVDVESRTVALDHHVVRVDGEGLVRKVDRKGGKGGLLLGLPPWSMPMWERVVEAAEPGTPLWTSTTGNLLDPSNTGKKVATMMDEIGYSWVTSHVLGRKTVTAVMDDADLPTTTIADQLGNTPAVVERHYRRRKKANAAAVEALEAMFDGAEGVG